MTEHPARILVTGSRDWTDVGTIQEALCEADNHFGDIIVVHGACPTGADAIADDWATRNGVPVERHPADWAQFGLSAGPRRNEHMVSLGADRCLAFIRNASRGASRCSALAEALGIPTFRWEVATPEETHG